MPTYQSYCGIQCDKCEYREKFNCSGCLATKGRPFWTKKEGNPCEVAACCISKDLKHCGECNEFPCELLNSFAYDKEQGDDGERIENLRTLT